MDFEAYSFNASHGDVIAVSATGLTVDRATIMLASPKEWKECRDAIDGDDTNVVMPCTAMCDATPEHTSVEFKIPSTGKWNIVFSPDQISRIAVSKQ